MKIKLQKKLLIQELKRVIEGYGNSEGISANVRYFRTSFVDKKKTTDQTRVALVARATDMIKVRENTFETVIEEDLFRFMQVQIIIQQ